MNTILITLAVILAIAFVFVARQLGIKTTAGLFGIVFLGTAVFTLIGYSF